MKKEQGMKNTNQKSNINKGKNEGKGRSVNGERKAGKDRTIRADRNICRDRSEERNVGAGKPEGNKHKQSVTSASGCPYADKCGGCSYQDVSYEKQLKLKQKQVETLLKDICPVYPIKGMENPMHYRNKVHSVFDRDRKGNIISGVYEEGTHRVVPVENCMIEDEISSRIITDIRDMLKSFKIKVYDEDTRFGLFRHVLVRRGFASKEVMIVLVLASPILPSRNHFVKALLAKHPEITTIVINVNDKKTSMVLGDREIVVYGKGYITDTLCGKTFKLSAKSFYQVNPVQTEYLYRRAIELAGLTGKETVIDAYCGIGTIGIIASDKAKEVISVELNKDAVRDAITNCRLNRIKNVQVYQNDAGLFMTGMAAQGATADVVFMDPPRSGSDEAFLSSVVILNPKKVVYISCNPETLARDLRYLTGKGYKAQGAWAYDMFPFTGHVETVVLLSDKKSTVM